MNAELIEDMKQLVSVLLSQQTALLRQEMKELEERLSRRIDNLAMFIGEAMDINSDEIDKRFSNHEHRIKKLEAGAL